MVSSMKSAEAEATVTELRPASASSGAPAPSIEKADLRKPPEWLSRQAATLWREIVPKLEDAFPEEITVVDVPALALMLEHLAITHAGARAMRGEGGWIKVLREARGANGPTMTKAPASQVMRDHAKAFLELAREYGLTPRARKLLDLGPPIAPDDDEDDDLFDT